MERSLDRRKQDRRKHVRFAMDKMGAELEVLGEAHEPLRTAACRLRNLSFSGMCFASDGDLEPHRNYSFRMRVPDLQDEPFAAKAEICWKQAAAEGGFLYGAVFRESSRGWLGRPR